MTDIEHSPEPPGPGYRAWVAGLTPSRRWLERELRSAQALALTDVVDDEEQGLIWVRYRGQPLAELLFDAATPRRDQAGWRLVTEQPCSQIEELTMPWDEQSDILLLMAIETWAALDLHLPADDALARTHAIRQVARSQSKQRAIAWGEYQMAATIAAHWMTGGSVPVVRPAGPSRLSH